jgi:uncharacterized membrane protein
MQIPPEFIVFAASMTPIGELRLGIPLGKAFGLSIPSTVVWALMGNLTIVLILLKILQPAVNYLENHSKPVKKFVHKIFKHTRHKHSKLFKEIGSLALVSFVAIPFPGTGGWTGALVAFLFGVRFWQATGLIFIGLLIAAALVTVGIESILIFANLLAG